MSTNCDVHQSDRTVTEIAVSPSGFPHEITHCQICNRAMSKPISHNDPRFVELANADAIAYVQSLGLLSKETDNHFEAAEGYRERI